MKSRLTLAVPVLLGVCLTGAAPYHQQDSGSQGSTQTEPQETKEKPPKKPPKKGPVNPNNPGGAKVATAGGEEKTEKKAAKKKAKNEKKEDMKKEMK